MYLLHVLIVVERFQPHAAHDPSAGGGSCFHGQDFNHTVFDLTYEAKYRCGTSSARCSWKNVLAADDCCTVIWFEFMLYIGPHWAKTRLWRFWMSMFLVLGSCFCTLSVSSSKQTNQLDARCLPSSVWWQVDKALLIDFEYTAALCSTRLGMSWGRNVFISYLLLPPLKPSELGHNWIFLAYPLTLEFECLSSAGCKTDSISESSTTCSYTGL